MALIRCPTTGLDRVALARLPTPLETAPRLARAIGVAALSIKRDDLAGYALGGNKLRQLDYILAEAIAAGADILVTTAGSQSNFCRSLAGAAAKAGLKAHLHLRRATGTALTGNLLLDHIFGATVTYTDATDPWDPVIAEQLAGIAEGYRQQGRTPQIVQLTGVTATTGISGWMAGAEELQADWGDAPPDWLVVACGSGLTLAGLALRFKATGAPTRLLGCSVQQPAARLGPWIVQAANETAHRLGLDTRLDRADFTLVDHPVAPGYGKPSAASVAAVRLAAETEGLLLDPVYTGKGLAGLITAVGDGVVAPTSRVVFLHSGGTPGLFAHADAFGE